MTKSTHSIEEFIIHARKKGMDHSTIRMLLLSTGWKEKEIAEALSSESLDIEIPLPPDVGGAREAFLHLLSFAALYTLVISMITLFFQYINRAFPDSAERIWSETADFSGIRMSMAAVIVSFPLLLWMSKLIHRDIASHPQKAWSGIRRWLTYITLFVAAASLMTNVITLVFSLLEGEWSIRFLLKVGVVFLFAGTTFMYYFLMLKSSVDKMKTLSRKFLVMTSGVIAFAVIWGIFIVGSPSTGRDYKFDEDRLQDLRDVQSEIFAIIYNDRVPKDPLVKEAPVKPLPATLEEVLEMALYKRPDIHDPETGVMYDYSILKKDSFKLCATFTHPYSEKYNIFWNHPEGYHCFTFDTSQRNYF